MDLQYAIIVIISIAIVIGVVMVWKKKSEENTVGDRGQMAKGSLDTTEVGFSDGNELAIQMEQLPIEMIPDDTQLVEVTDSKVLARIDSLIPGLGQAGVATANVVQAQGGQSFRLVLSSLIQRQWKAL